MKEETLLYIFFAISITFLISAPIIGAVFAIYGPNAIFESLFYPPRPQESEYASMFGWEKPTYQEIVEFIDNDPTNLKEYRNGNFTCKDFSEMSIYNARKHGFNAGFVTIYQTEDEYVNYWNPLDAAINAAHAIVCFDTSDRGLYFLEPQGDIIIPKKALEEMVIIHYYPYADESDPFNSCYFGMDFHHYKIEWYHNIYCYWSDQEGKWNVDYYR